MPQTTSIIIIMSLGSVSVSLGWWVYLENILSLVKRLVWVNISKPSRKYSGSLDLVSGIMRGLIERNRLMFSYGNIGKILIQKLLISVQIHH